jgi:hypothetical protein
MSSVGGYCFQSLGYHLFYLLVVEPSGRLAGFALVKRGSEITGDEYVWDMAEFFVVRRSPGHFRWN